jgi:hypothetical protein
MNEFLMVLELVLLLGIAGGVVYLVVAEKRRKVAEELKSLQQEIDDAYELAVTLAVKPYDQVAHHRLKTKLEAWESKYPTLVAEIMALTFMVKAQPSVIWGYRVKKTAREYLVGRLQKERIAVLGNLPALMVLEFSQNPVSDQ